MINYHLISPFLLKVPINYYKTRNNDITLVILFVEKNVNKEFFLGAPHDFIHRRIYKWLTLVSRLFTRITVDDAPGSSLTSYFAFSSLSVPFSNVQRFDVPFASIGTLELTQVLSEVMHKIPGIYHINGSRLDKNKRSDAHDGTSVVPMRV